MPAESRRTPVTQPLGDSAGDTALDMVVAPSTLGRLGRYELLSLLAQGGMGEVYLARSRGLGGFEKLVVIKRSLPSLASDREPLFAEARLVATLQHTNIVQVNDVDSDGATVFIAMEYLHGQDVRHVLRRAWADGRRLSLDQALAIAQAVCAGLHYAHDKRDGDGAPLEIVHRDVSPSNVFVTYDGGVKLIDFGIAKATTLPSETQLGTIKGKPGYMSPEQCRGESVDRRSDVFCVGILLYEMTTGRRPFVGDSEYLVYRQICEDAPPAPTAIVAGYPPALEAIVLRALAKDRRERYPSAGVLHDELVQFATAHRADTSQWALQRCLGELFRDELDAWREAQRTGQSLVEHVIRNSTGSVPVLRGRAADALLQPPRSEPASEGTAAATKSERRRPRRARWLAVVGAGVLAGVIPIIAVAVTRAGSEHPDERAAIHDSALPGPAVAPSTPPAPATTPAAPAVPHDVPRAAEPPAVEEAPKRAPGKAPGGRVRKTAPRTSPPPADTTPQPPATGPGSAVTVPGPDDPL